MKHKALKIGIIVMLIALVIFLVPPISVPLSEALNSTGTPGAVNTVFMIMLGIAGILIAWPVIVAISIKLDLWSLKKGIGGRKCFTLVENIKSAMTYITEKTGIVELFIYDQDVEDPETDIPYVTFMITDWKINMETKNREHEIEKHRRWFIIVNRLTNEVSNRWGTIHSWEEADFWMMNKKQRDIPMEKKKSAMDKLSEGVIKGYVEKLGSEAAAVEPRKEKKGGKRDEEE